MPVAVGGSFFYFVSLGPYLIRNNLYTIQGGNELWQKLEKFNVFITRRNQVENRHVLITDVRRWNAFRERKGISMNKLVKVISPRKEREVPKYFREFWIHNQKTNKRSDKADILGYSFPCFEDGTVDTNDSSYESWKQNYEYCMSHPEEFDDAGVIIQSITVVEPATYLCSCGNDVDMVPFKDGLCWCYRCKQRYTLTGIPVPADT